MLNVNAYVWFGAKIKLVEIKSIIDIWTKFMLPSFITLKVEQKK